MKTTYMDTEGNLHIIHCEEAGNPTPMRGWDYIASLDSYDGAPDGGPQLYGRGATMLEAIAELMERIEEDL